MAVTSADIAVALGRLEPTPNDVNDLQWSMWIADARWIISAGDGSHDGLGDLDDLDQTTLDFVVREAVSARARLDLEASAMGDEEPRRTFGSRGIRIRAEWWGMLDPDLTDSGAFSVSPAFEADFVPAAIVDYLSTEWGMQGGGFLP